MNQSNDKKKECINLSYIMNQCREKNHNIHNCKEKCKEINDSFTLLCRNDDVVNIIKK
jgi:hypothetical protein